MDYYLIKIKGSRFSDVFESPQPYGVSNEVIVRSERGLEVGKIMRIMHPMETFGTVESIATAHDLDTHWFNIDEAKHAKEICKKHIAALNSEMKPMSVLYNLDRSKIFINFTSDKRVDFRDLLKALSKDLKTRIELNHLGGRDYAKIVGCIGTCGRTSCCAFKRDFSSVTMSMAKNQMMPLNNEALSGVCGNLKCCIGFENDQYTQCRKNFPKIKSTVIYLEDEYKVLDINCLSDKVLISNKKERIYVDLKDLIRERVQI